MKKRIINIIVCFFCCILCDAADTFTSNTIEGVPVKYTIIGNSVKVGYEYVSKGTYTYYPAINTSTEGTVTIPSTVTYGNKTYNVTRINNQAFKGCSKITSVFIPESVSYLGASVFEDCSNLTSFSIPSCVEELQYNTFKNCISLSEITIPNVIINIGKSVFEGCVGLKSVEIPNSVTSIDNSAFYGCTSLKTVEIPNSVTSIGNSAFYGCTSLTSVEISNNVTYVGNNAFENCSSLVSAIMPQSVDNFGTSVFDGCVSLKNVNIPEGVSGITLTLGALSSLILPNSLISLSLYDCNTLESIVLPVNLTNLNISNCESLQTLITSNSIRTVSLYNCPKLSVLELGNNIEKLTISGTLLTKLNLPSSIDKLSLSSCDLLEEVVLSKGATTAGEFYNCPILKKVTIPENVTIINYSVYRDCPQLDQIYCYLQEPISIWYRAFEDITSQATLYVPYQKKSVFENAQYWKAFTIKENSVDEGDIFVASTKLSKNINMDVKYIVKSINPLESEIGCKSDVVTSAFESELSGDITIPNFIKDSYDALFSIVGLGKNSFCNSGISSIRLPQSIRYIDQDSFKGCSQLSTINIPNSVVDIEDAFTGCTSLRTIIVGWRNPSEVSISTNVFSDIPNDAILYVPAGTKERYEALEPWNRFSQIIESSPISVGDISASFNSQANLPVYLKNTETVEGLQFKLTLPEGVTVVNDNGMLVTSNTERTEGMTIMGRKDPDEENSYLFILFSLNDNSILGNNGGIMNVRLNLASDIELGTYDIKIDDIYMTTTSLETLHPSESSSELTVKDYMLGDVNNDGIINITDAIGIVNHVLKNTPAVFVEGAADVNMDGFINVTDAIAVINMILN